MTVDLFLDCTGFYRVATATAVETNTSTRRSSDVQQLFASVVNLFVADTRRGIVAQVVTA